MSRKFTNPNRAICAGDQARAGIGETVGESTSIQRQIADWTTPFLKKFLKTCKSQSWRKEVHNLILVREGVSMDLLILNSKRARRKNRAKPSSCSGLRVVP